MMKKTVARRHAKQLPMSSDILALLTRDDELYDLDRERGERIQAPRQLSDRLDFLAGVDPETGEFPDSVDEVSTPSSQSAASDDILTLGSGDEGAAQHSGGAHSPSAPERVGDEPPLVAATQPEPVAAMQAGSQAPPGAAQTPAPAPGGSSSKPKTSEPDLLSLSLEERGEAMAKKGRTELERWVNELPADDMAKVSLAQLKAWRTVAAKEGTHGRTT
jgi:hypothetical protein